MFSCLAKRRMPALAALVTAVLLSPGALAQDPAPPDPPAPADAPAPPPTEPRPRRRFFIGPEVGVYLPSAGKTRDRFGDAWTSIGIGFGAIRSADAKGAIGLDLSVLSTRSGDNRALLVPVGVSYRRALTARSDVTPYAGVSGNLVFADLRSDEDNVSSGVRTAAGASVFLGTTLRRNGYIEARYLALSRVRGFDLSGLNLQAGYRF